MQFLSHHISAINELPSLANDHKLDRYLAWDHDCTFELAFTKSRLEALGEESSALVPHEVVIKGILEPASDVLPVFEIAAAHAHELSQFGEYSVFTFGSSFERKDVPQAKNYASSVKVHCSFGKAKFEFTHLSKEDSPLSEVVGMAEEMLAKSPVVDLNTIRANWWAVRSDLSSVNGNAIRLLNSMVRELGSGQVFEHSWSASIMGVDEENVTKHGFELFNRVAQSGLTANEIKVLIKVRLLDVRGLGLVRQLCEGETNYTIPLGTFRHQKKKAILGVFADKDGYRLSLTLKDIPTEAEWTKLESTLGTTFNRKPFS